MFLIADSGSTKTEWCLVHRDKSRKIFRTAGINPVHLSRLDIEEILRNELTCDTNNIRHVFFYGAGCAFTEKNRQVEEALRNHFGGAEITVESDLLAAARSLCQHAPGVCCILGTGSNSCYYDGTQIVHNVPPLGYILGDEGSGAALGRKLLADMLKGLISQEIRTLFDNEYGYTYDELIDKVYGQPLPNRFLSGLTHFIYKHTTHPEIMQLVADAFDEFIKRNVLQYDEARLYPISFTGSTAFYFKDLLENRLKRNLLTLGTISHSPMNGLVYYHQHAHRP